LEDTAGDKFVGGSTVSQQQALHVAGLLKARAFIECSSETGENIKLVFDEAIKTALGKKTKRRKDKKRKTHKPNCVMM